MKRLMIVGISVMALVACGNSDDGSGTTAPATSAVPGQQTATAAPGSALPNVAEGQPSAEAPAEVPAANTGAPAAPAAPAVPAAPAAPAQPAGCLEMDSPAVTNAVDTLPRYFPDDPWTVYKIGDKCASFTWVAATASDRATASTPNHYLFFADGRYLGTATYDPHSFTFVSGQSADTITIGYRWLIGDDAFADPTGGPALIRYQWDGSQVTMLDSLPPEVAGG